MLKSMLYGLPFFLFTQMSFAQTIQLDDSGACYGNGMTLTLNGNDGGTPARNIYTGPNGFGATIRIIWNAGNSRWEIQYDTTSDGNYDFTDFANTTASAPNPPALGTGVWSPLNNPPCGIITQLQGSGTTLPVALLAFNSVIRDDHVILYWQTASEVNNDKFVIERSSDGRAFQKIGELKGKGTTLEQQHYSFEVKRPRNGISYYRLKQIDFNRQFDYSEVISVHYKGQNGNVGEFYPNPSQSGWSNLNYLARSDDEIRVSVFDITGALVDNQIKQISNGGNHLSFDFSDLNSGIYVVKIGDERNPTYRKLIIE